MKNESTRKDMSTKAQYKIFTHDSIRVSEREKGSGKSCVVLFKKNKNNSTQYAEFHYYS